MFVRWSLSLIRWMAPKNIRLIPTLYIRGSKTGSKQPRSPLQTTLSRFLKQYGLKAGRMDTTESRGGG